MRTQQRMRAFRATDATSARCCCTLRQLQLLQNMQSLPVNRMILSQHGCGINGNHRYGTYSIKAPASTAAELPPAVQYYRDADCMTRLRQPACSSRSAVHQTVKI
jgi:hypothetical protein